MWRTRSRWSGCACAKSAMWWFRPGRGRGSTHCWRRSARASRGRGSGWSCWCRTTAGTWSAGCTSPTPRSSPPSTWNRAPGWRSWSAKAWRPSWNRSSTMADPHAAQSLRLLDAAVETMGGQNRPGQHEMAARVAEASAEGPHLLGQAGTGTGKSLAYLVPLIDHALGSDKPAVVATATLALQAQIVNRALPRLLEAIGPQLPRPVEVALLKGRSNYVCLHKLGGGFPEDDEPQALFSLG